MLIGPLTPADFDWVVELNAANVVATGLIDHAWLDEMFPQWFSAKVVAPDAFMIAFDESADYSSPNFVWFRERMTKFAYVDRIVVSEGARGRGIARALYMTLFARAASAGKPAVVCEVNIDPPNPSSDAFHARLGFIEAGRATLANGKTVRYLSRALE